MERKRAARFLGILLLTSFVLYIISLRPESLLIGVVVATIDYYSKRILNKIDEAQGETTDRS